MRCSPNRLWPVSLLALLSVLCLAPTLKADRLVVARAVASSDYLQSRMVDGKRQPQSYVFMPGRYFAGNTHDNSLQKTPFRTIAERLALDLKQQDFHPAKSLGEANLLLMVHWGVTVGRNRDSVALSAGSANLVGIALASQDAQRDLDDAVSRMDVSAAAQARGELDNLSNDNRFELRDMVRAQREGSEDSATLLGFSAALRKESASLFEYERQQTLFGLAVEECYFVIVMAYDVPTLLRDKKLKRVWTLRTSMSSAGVNFHQALDRIGNVASRYFGTRQDTVTFDFTGDRKRTERVEIGDLIVLGPANP